MSTISDNAKAIFLGALENHSPEDWEALLSQACGENQRLRWRIEELLAAAEAVDSLLDLPETSAAAPIGKGLGPSSMKIACQDFTNS